METQTLMDLVDTAELVNEPYEKTDENLQRAAELENLGFVQLAQDILKKVEAKDKRDRITKWGYLCITKEKIEQYLNKKVDLYNAQFRPSKAAIVVPAQANPFTSLMDSFLLGGSFQERAGSITAQPMSDFYRYMTSQIMVSPTSFIIVPTNPDETKISSKPTCHYQGGGEVGRYIWTEKRLSSYATLPPEHVLGILKEHQSRKVFDYFTIASVNAVRDPLLLGRVDGTEDRFYIAQWGDDVALEDVL